MVEVVQDLLDHVTYAGGVGRRRVDSVRGFGAGTPRPGDSDYAVLKEDSSSRGPELRQIKELMFIDLLDKPFEEKCYRTQLEEFAFRGERIVSQIDRKFGEVQGMIDCDALRRSLTLPPLLRAACEELHKAHGLICGELEDVWHMRFAPFFFPCESAWAAAPGDPAPASPTSRLSLLSASASSSSATPLAEPPSPMHETDEAFRMPGGWLDLDDIILTARLLIRHIAEIVSLVGMAVRDLPADVFSAQFHAAQPHPALASLVETFALRAPWMGVALCSEEERDAAARAAPSRAASALNEAMATLDGVLTVHMKGLLSDLHRTMYQAFVRMCAAYARWKRIFKEERKAVTVRERRLTLGSTRRNTIRRNRRNTVTVASGLPPDSRAPSKPTFHPDVLQERDAGDDDDDAPLPSHSCSDIPTVVEEHETQDVLAEMD